jgi:hypothetical protein
MNRNPKLNVELYRKVFDSLVPGGTIVIRDHVMSEDHTETVEGALQRSRRSPGWGDSSEAPGLPKGGSGGNPS